MKLKHFIQCSLILTLLNIACVKEKLAPEQPEQPKSSLMTKLKNNDDFSLFYGALQRAGLDKTILSEEKQLTLFIPDNTAFANSGIDQDSLNRMNSADLRQLVAYHIVATPITYVSIPQTINTPYKTEAGMNVYLSQPISGPDQFADFTNRVARINGSTIRKLDILAANGVIHLLDRVLRPPLPSVAAILASDPNYSYFVAGLKKFNLWDRLLQPGRNVAFAPSNIAFENQGITLDDINNMDPNEFKPLVFGAYVVDDLFFFLTDFFDAPIPPVRWNNSLRFSPILSKDVAIMTTADGEYFRIGGILPLNYYDEFLKTRDINSTTLGYGYGTEVTSPNNLALNGIVHGIDALLINPIKAKKN